jgi:hypothetical protein
LTFCTRAASACRAAARGCRRDGRLHVLAGGIDVAVEAELDRDLREPSALVEVIESTPAIVVNCFSSGVATADAMVSGLAPGRLP